MDHWLSPFSEIGMRPLLFLAIMFDDESVDERKRLSLSSLLGARAVLLIKGLLEGASPSCPAALALAC